MANTDSGTLILQIILIIVFIILSMIFSASESAFLAINKLRIRVLRNKKDAGAQKVGKLLDKKTELLNSLLLGNNIVNIGITAMLTAICMQLFGARGVEVATLVATVFLLIFGEITPKTIANAHPEKIATIFAPFLALLNKVFAPVVRIFTKFGNFVAGFFGANGRQKNVSFTEEEIKTIIDAGEAEGVIESAEKTMLRQVFKFSDLNAKEIMVPRTNIKAVSVDASFEEILEFSKSTGFSKFPVFENDLDHICGFVYLKDLLFYTIDQNCAGFSVKSVLRSPLYILENRRISTIRKIFEENKQSIAIIIDEYSQTSGLITVEDLTTEIFGNVSDERTGEEKPLLQRINETETEIDGTMRLSELSELLGVQFESEFFDTLGGFIAEQYGNLPWVGLEIESNGYSFLVTGLDGRRVSRVLVKKQKQAE